MFATAQKGGEVQHPPPPDRGPRLDTKDEIRPPSPWPGKKHTWFLVVDDMGCNTWRVIPTSKVVKNHGDCNSPK